MTQEAPVNSGAPASTGMTVWERVARTQAKYHCWAKADRNARFGDLFNLVCHPSYLLVAWEHVARNTGARTGGVDGLTARRVEHEVGMWRFIKDIAHQLKAGTYRPSPVRQRLIPKPGGKSRPLGIPTIADRVVQQSLKMVSAALLLLPHLRFAGESWRGDYVAPRPSLAGGATQRDQST